MRIVDTHLHLVYQQRLSYPWLGGAPALNRDWHLDDYWAEAKPLGIEAALHMEVDVAPHDIEAETAFVTGLPAPIVGAIASGRPESEGFAAYLDRAAANPKLKAIRRVLHTMPDELSQTGPFAENIRRLSAKRLPFDLCIRADQLRTVGIPLVDKCPDVQFVLDHCGVPDVAGRALDPWRADITELSKRPNVAAKLSGICAYAGPDWTVETLRPFADHIVQSFGWDRVVWGSDHPVVTLTASLTRWVEATNALLSGAADDDKARLLHRNAERIYHL